MAVSKRVRFEVLRRDNHTCRYCGGTAPDVVITIDHVLPVALGGSDDPSNLVAACKDCNAGKTSTNPDAPLLAQVSDDALRWAQAVAQAAMERSVRQEPIREYVDDFEQAWDAWKYPNGSTISRPNGWPQSVQRFYDVGLPIDDLLEAVRIACGNDKIRNTDKFRYMCGAAWKMVTEIQDAARGIYDAPVTVPMPRGDIVRDFMDRRYSPLVEATAYGPVYNPHGDPVDTLVHLKALGL